MALNSDKTGKKMGITKWDMLKLSSAFEGSFNPADFSEEELFRNNISLFTKEFYLDSYKVSEDKIFLFTKNSSSPEIVLKICPDILNLKISGYDVVVTWLKFHSHQYTRSTFSDTDFAELLNLLCAIKTQLFLISKLDLLLEKELNSPSNWLD